MSVKVKVEMQPKDFFIGYLERKEDPIWYALADMHDLAYLNKAKLTEEEKQVIIDETKFLSDQLIKFRESKYKD